jgi:hypothetical protein
MNTTQAIGRMREVIRRQHKALSTEDSYVFWLRLYMTALRQMPEGLSSEKKLKQLSLLRKGAASNHVTTQVQIGV